MKLNIGAGENRLEGFINIDREESTNPDILCDIRQKIPLEDNCVEELWFHHCLEHIEFHSWKHIFAEFHRVLIQDGLLYISYPEFEMCAKYFIENKAGDRDFWRKCLYGRQQYNGDYHVSPVHTKELIPILELMGFKNIVFQPQEYPNFQYTFLKCYKGHVITTEDIIRNEVFGGDLIKK